ncbi:MAG: type II toxin-antitoxin system HicB family antitoxin [Candidatus Binataceae bacterium]
MPATDVPAKLRFRVVLYPDEDGVFIVEAPALPGCVSQGKTRAAALRNIREAIAGYLDTLRAHEASIPAAS